MNTLHRRNLDLNLLVLFHAIFVERSVSAAARRLGMSQSALSHGLARLRKAFQDDLFVRSGLSITPTIRAQQLFEPIREILDKVQGQILPSVGFDPIKGCSRVSNWRIGCWRIVLLPPLIRKSG